MREYNGWTNYETWAVKLWIDNDQGTHEWWHEQALECVAEGLRDPDPYDVGITPEQRARYLLADRLKDVHEEEAGASLDESPPTVFTDLLGAALGEVNWNEIAEALLDIEKVQP